MSEATNDGVRIAYEVLGDGEPLLFVHGLGYDRRGWGPLPALLAADFQVLLFDNRGVGESDVPEGPYAVSQMAADAVAVVVIGRRVVADLAADPGGLLGGGLLLLGLEGGF